MTFITASLNGAAIRPTRDKPVASGADFETGALLIEDGNGEWAECGADPAAVAAVSEAPFGADDSGFNRLARKEFPPGFMQATPVQDAQLFHAEYVGTLPAAAGGSYGVVRGADGKWRVDFAEVTALVVKLVSLEWTEAPFNRNRVLVMFLPGVVQNV